MNSPKISCWDDMEVPEESFHWSSWDSRTCYPWRAFIQGLTDDCSLFFLLLSRPSISSGQQVNEKKEEEKRKRPWAPKRESLATHLHTKKEKRTTRRQQERQTDVWFTSLFSWCVVVGCKIVKGKERETNETQRTTAKDFQLMIAAVVQVSKLVWNSRH